MSMLETHHEARRNKEKYLLYRSSRADFDTRAIADIDFAIHGNHFTPSESAKMKEIGQADPTVDRLGAGIAKLVSMLTARPPSYKFIGREESDQKMAYVWSEVGAYVWDISDGNVQSKEAITDYSVAGLGFLKVYFDPMQDYWSGDIKVIRKSLFDIYAPPNTQNRFFEDASDILESTILDGNAVINMLGSEFGTRNPETGQIEGKLKEIESTQNSDYPTSQQTNTTQAKTPADSKSLDPSQLNYHLLERYEPVMVPFYRVADGETNEVLTKMEFFTLLADNDVVLKTEDFDQLVSSGDGIIGNLQWVEVPQKRIRHVVTLGQILLRDEVLHTDIYPIIPLANIWTSTPYPLSDVSKARDPQLLLDRIWSLILSHAQASIGARVLLPEGSIEDEDAFAETWNDPNGFMYFNAEMGTPVIVPPIPLTSEFYNLMSQLQFQIDFILGIPEILQGFGDKAPDTASQTQLLSDAAQGRPRSKLQDILACHQRVGKVVYNYSKAHYSAEKILRIVQANNDAAGIDKKYYQDKLPTVEEIERDRLIGSYDVRVVNDSIMPHDPYAEYALYLNAVEKLGVPPSFAIRKLPELFDVREIAETMDEITQLNQALDQADEQIKKLEGDLQSADRESTQSRKRAITSEFQTKVDKVANKLEANSRVEIANLGADIRVLFNDLESSLREGTQVNGDLS